MVSVLWPPPKVDIGSVISGRDLSNVCESETAASRVLFLNKAADDELFGLFLTSFQVKEEDSSALEDFFTGE